MYSDDSNTPFVCGSRNGTIQQQGALRKDSNEYTYDLIRSYGIGSISSQSNEGPTRCAKRINQPLLLSALLSPHFKTYPHSRAFRRKFWKVVIAELDSAIIERGGGEEEEEEIEVDERIYETYVGLLNEIEHGNGLSIGASNIVKPPEDCYINFYYPSPNRPQFCGPALSSIPSSESGPTQSQTRVHAIPNHLCATFLTSLVSIQAGTTGLATWEAAYHLAEHLARNPEIVRRRSVLELGAGTGLVGIVVARIQAEGLGADLKGKTESKLTITDLDASVMKRCRRNVFLPPNGIDDHANVHFDLLDWSDVPHPRKHSEPSGKEEKEEEYTLASSSTSSHFIETIRRADAELVLGSDIVYDPSTIPSLVETLYYALSLPTTGRSTKDTGGERVRSVQIRSQVCDGSENRGFGVGERKRRERKALISLTVRRDETVRLFEEALDQRGMEWNILPHSFTSASNSRSLDLTPPTNVRIYDIRFGISK